MGCGTREAKLEIAVWTKTRVWWRAVWSFVDFEKAFDRVKWTKLTNQRICVRTSKREKKAFKYYIRKVKAEDILRGESFFKEVVKSR